MIKIVAQSKRQSVSFSPKLFLILGFFVGSIILSYYLYTNPIATITIFISSIILFIYYTQPPSRQMVELTDDYLKINSEIHYLKDIIAWSIGEYETLYEVMIKKNRFDSITSIYLSKHNPNTQPFIELMLEKCKFDEEMYFNDPIQNFMKLIGLK
jgi:uncharacterized membrane protein